VEEQVEQARAFPRVVSYERTAASVERSSGSRDHDFFAKAVSTASVSLYNGSGVASIFSVSPKGSRAADAFGKDPRPSIDPAKIRGLFPRRSGASE
jgi:hypothetical protein